MGAAKGYYSREYSDKISAMYSDALCEIELMNRQSQSAESAFFQQLFEFAAKRNEILALLINISIEANKLFYAHTIDQLREIVRRTRDDILENNISLRVPMAARIKLQSSNIELAKAICQLDLAASPEIDKVFEGRKTYA